jgi:hypothetical protein
MSPEELRGLLAELPLGRTLQVELTSGSFTLKLNMLPQASKEAEHAAPVPLTEEEERLAQAFGSDFRKTLLNA